MKVLVLGGSGAIGSETTRDLVLTSDFSEIAVADLDYHKASHFCDMTGDSRLLPIEVDVSSGENLKRLFAEYPLVINCSSYRHALTVTEAAIAAGSHLVDLGAFGQTPRQLELAGQAVEAGVLVLLGCGATPGITNLMVRRAARHLAQVESVSIAFASYRPLAPSPGLLDKVLDAFGPSLAASVWDQGHLVDVGPFDGERLVSFHDPVGRVPTYLSPNSEVFTLPTFLPGGLGRLEVRGTWRPEIMEAMRVLHRIGLLSDDPLPGRDYSAKQALRDVFLAQNLREDDGPSAFYLHTEVRGHRDGQVANLTYDLSHPGRDQWGGSCTAKVTGIPASIGAQLLAKGLLPECGVVPVEACVDPDLMFAELARRDLRITEKLIAEQELGVIAPEEA